MKKTKIYIFDEVITKEKKWCWKKFDRRGKLGKKKSINLNAFCSKETC